MTFYQTKRDRAVRVRVTASERGVLMTIYDGHYGDQAKAPLSGEDAREVAALLLDMADAHDVKWREHGERRERDKDQ